MNRVLPLLVFIAFGALGFSQTGPLTEKRFPPLKVPPGFEAKLFACDPLIEYPSAIALGPKQGTLFVAIDYMTGLGTEIIRRDEIRLIEDKDGDGYAETATVFADGFNSIQGMTYDRGTVYVMHAPFLTALRDTDGDGKADERKDLLKGLGLPPEKNPVRLHCANGIVAGYDGWLYLAMGDNGSDVERPEGDRLVLQGGGILRCRRDGRDLHVFAKGLRNIYDVALDAENNVFVRDNENDGGEYMIRLCHSFFGADHGYPYLYYERPREALPPLGDLGLGSSAGGVCYLETAFPKEYHGNLFWCEWGRAVMRSVPKRKGAGFEPMKEIEFASGDPKDPYGFKPTDLVVDRDGSLLIADWCDGQRPKRGRGRIYRVSAINESKQKPKSADLPVTVERLLEELDSPSYYRRIEAQRKLEAMGEPATVTIEKAQSDGQLGERAELHAPWILAHSVGEAAIPKLLQWAQLIDAPAIQTQAIRALADLADPVLAKHSLQAGRGSIELAKKLSESPSKGHAHKEIVIALGRLKWRYSALWMFSNVLLSDYRRVLDSDPTLFHAAMQTIRQSANWGFVFPYLDSRPLPFNNPFPDMVAELALGALAEQYDPEIVDRLIGRLKGARFAKSDFAERRRQFADLLTRVYKKPGPWTYWGYRPAPRPANTVAWEKTEAIELALDGVLSDPDFGVRHQTLLRMQREKIPVRLSTLQVWLRKDFDAARVSAVLKSVKEQSAADGRSALMELILHAKHTEVSRLSALTMLRDGLDAASEATMLKLVDSLEDGPVLASALEELGRRPNVPADAVLVRRTTSTHAAVRAAALGALAERNSPEATKLAERLLDDADILARRAAVSAVGKLMMQGSADRVLALAKLDAPRLKRVCLDTLQKLKDDRAVPFAVAGLSDAETQAAALAYLEAHGGPAQAAPIGEVALRDPTADTQLTVLRTLGRWASQDESIRARIATIQGSTGILLQWSVASPEAKPAQFAKVATAPPGAAALLAGADGRIELKSKQTLFTDVTLADAATVQFLTGSNSAFRFHVDGRLLHERKESKAFQADSDRFETSIEKGTHRLWVELEPAKGTTVFQARFRRKNSNLALEQLAQLALSKPGVADRGKKVFLDVAKSQCLKCHRLGDQGEKIGPDLVGVGKRFARVHLIESILEPNRSLAPGFQTLFVELKNGQVLTGLPVGETATALVLADKDGKRTEVPLANIESRRPHTVSIMPEGLERQLSADEFVDLIAFLSAQR